MLTGDDSKSTADIKQENMVPLEDIAWVDSCFVNDPESSDELSSGDWNVFGDAFFEILGSSQAGTVNSGNRSSPENVDMEVSSNEKMSISPTKGRATDFGETEMSGDGKMMNAGPDSSPAAKEHNSDGNMSDDADIFWSKYKLEDVFLPSYNERKITSIDSTADSAIPTFRADPSSSEEDIFRVWDLGIVEENEYIRQLNKALSDYSGHSRSHDSTTSEASIDDLISGIESLSFNKKEE